MKDIVTIILVFSAFSLTNSQDYPNDFCNCEKHIIKSDVLNLEHTIFVYLPTNYGADTNIRYPVHYVADAPLTSNIYANLVQLHSMGNDIPQGIVVGLSSNHREFNLHPEKGAGAYLRFIETEVIPFINRKYKTEDFKILAGHSLSGIFAIYTHLNNPNLFNAYILGSPGPVEPIIEQAKRGEQDQISNSYQFIYSSIGSDDLTDSASFYKLSGTINNYENLDVHFVINRGQNHFSNMTVNIQDAIRQLYNDWKFNLPDKPDKSVDKLIKEHYDNLELKFGYRPIIGEWEVFFPVMHKLAQSGDMKNAIAVLEYCIEIHPQSDQAYAFLAKAHIDLGKIDAAKDYVNKSLKLNPRNEFANHLKMMINKQSGY